MGMCSFGSDRPEELDQQCYSPQNVSRGQTDCLCCLVFLFCTTLTMFITGYAAFMGDMRRFEGLPNSAGQICGVDELVIDKPYLYFCLDQNVGISLKHVQRQCVAQCPDSAGMGAPCGISYPSKEYAGLICAPTKTEVMADLSKSLEKHPTFKIMMEIANVPKAWEPIACSAVLAIVLGFAFLLALRQCTCLVWVGLGAIVLVSGFLGLYFAYAAMTGGADGLPATGDSKIDWLISLSSLVLCAVFGCIIVFKRSSIEFAENCIKAACECIYDMKSLLFEPFLALAIRGLIFLVLLTGLLLVYSCKEDKVTDGNVRFSIAEWQYYIIGFYIFMIIWIMELCNAMSQFVVSYAVEMWFFSGYNSQSNSKDHPGLTFATCEAYCTALRHHIGSLAFGSFIIAVFRAFQYLMSFLTKSAEGSGNAVFACLGKVCVCCIACFRKIIEHLNKNAYMDIALNGNGFCAAAYHAMLIMTNNATAVIVLKGATWLFELAGLGGITAAGVGLTFWMLKAIPKFSDPTSANFVQDPMIVCVVSGVVCLLLALPFVIVFGHAADTILYCFAVDKKRNPDVVGMAASAVAEVSGAFGWLASLFYGGSSKDAQDKLEAYGKEQIGAYGESLHPPETEALLKMAVPVATKVAVAHVV